MDGAKRDFTLRQLNIFVCAARTGSFARAADQLGISQPAVSGCIALLEERLGRRLFARRSGTTPLLTLDGAELLERAEGLLSTSEIMRGRGVRGGTRQERVRLCIGPLLRDVYLKPMLPRLYREHPDIALEFVPVIAHAEVQTALDKGRVDLVVYTVGERAQDWPNARLVCEVPTVMIGPPGINRRLAASGERIEDLPFILPATEGLSEHWLERQLTRLGHHPRQRITYIDFPDVIQEMVADGQGVSVLMRDQVSVNIARGRLEVFGPAFPPMQRVIARSSRASGAARVVEDYLAAIFRESMRAAEEMEAGVPADATL